MNNTRKKELKRRRALELLNTGMKPKYPKGSKIIFSSKYNKGEKPVTASCSWYDKVGGKRPLKHIIDKPPEWQNIPLEEANEIAAMFDDNLFLNLVYV